MGWTRGIAVLAMGRWYNPMGSHMSRLGQCDGMDGSTSHGMVVQSHGTGWTGGMAVPAIEWGYNPIGSYMSHMSRMVPGIAHMYHRWTGQ